MYRSRGPLSFKLKEKSVKTVVTVLVILPYLTSHIIYENPACRPPPLEASGAPQFKNHFFMEYCVQTWCLYYQKDRAKLEQVHLRVATLQTIFSY